ncbi:MAG: M23 family metallopeptidase [Acidimicrobiales bacterium]
MFRSRRAPTIQQCLATSVAALLATGAAVVGAALPAAAAPRTCASGGAVHQVADGDTWFGIAGLAKVPMATLLDANGATVASVIHPGDQLCLPAGADPAASTTARSGPCTATSARYTVVDGDGWFVIARRVGTTMDELLQANGASVDTVLVAGRQLCLPAGARTVASTPSIVPLDALPVQGPCWYGDTWRDGRGNGRTHEGVDLIVSAGNYIYAVADGVLTRRHWDQPGSLSGNAWWLTTADGTYFFYAHLSDFAPGLKVGSRVKAGQIIGFVGSTGNSATAHLHFEVHPYGGGPINPYPTVRAAGGCRTGSGYQQPNGWVPTD